MKCNKLTLNEKRSYEYDPQYLRLKSQNRTLRKQMKMITNLFKLVCIMMMVLIGSIIISANQINTLSNQVALLEEQNILLVEKNKELSSTFNYLSETLETTAQMVVELDNDNTTLVEDNYVLINTVKEYEKREELFDKYDYAIMRSNGSRTDITYDNIKNIQQLVEEKGMEKETVDLILSLAMTESNGNEKIDNKSSSARGYGQILSSTGEFVYCKLMDNDSYKHELAYDGDTNFAMMVNYVDYLDDKNKGDMNKTIINYRGVDEEYYKEKVDSYLAFANLSLNTIDLRREKY